MKFGTVTSLRFVVVFSHWDKKKQDDD